MRPDKAKVILCISLTVVKTLNLGILNALLHRNIIAAIYYDLLWLWQNIMINWSGTRILFSWWFVGNSVTHEWGAVQERAGHDFGARDMWSEF